MMASTVTFENNSFTFAVTCVDKSTPTQSTFVVTAPNASYVIGANDTSNFPAGSSSSAATYQGAAQLPALCGNKAGNIRLQQGGTFTSLLSATDTTDKVQVQWHYVDSGAGKPGTSVNCSTQTGNPDPGIAACNGGWSGTLSTVPGTAASSISYLCQLDGSGFPIGRWALRLDVEAREAPSGLHGLLRNHGSCFRKRGKDATCMEPASAFLAED